jgi:hypothetical protein
MEGAKEMARWQVFIGIIVILLLIIAVWLIAYPLVVVAIIFGIFYLAHEFLHWLRND